jgi:formamidopyrimidine-DNA glycosylase
MPELPDVTIYVEAIRERVAGRVLERIRIVNPFLLRSVTPPPEELRGRRTKGVRRIGKRIVLELEDDCFAVIHLMIAGRFRWSDPGAKIPGKLGLAAFDFDSGSLILTEAGSKRRASLHLVRGEEALLRFDAGGVEVLGALKDAFTRALRSENHTLKRALTDPRLFSGIGNAYSDEILHRARLSPLTLTSKIGEKEVARLYDATRSTLEEWIARLRAESAGRFPDKVTAFRKEMAVHGRYGEPCPDCGSPVQRIVYAENETNYCARCQTGGRLLADRALSRLLRDDWPRSIDDIE